MEPRSHLRATIEKISEADRVQGYESFSGNEIRWGEEEVSTSGRNGEEGETKDGQIQVTIR